MIGKKLGPYEILEKVGAGGMGEVYRASDTRLGRQVAVKVLPPHFSTDPDRLLRFEQEARAAGMLNHPNILAIHDIGTHEGSPYVVSEFLEGDTLRQRIGGSALPPRKAIDYAIQMAQGLAAAHDKGVVHRDLKPDNLFITEDGRLKILDFGLAKLTRPEDSGEALTNLPTAAHTEPGKILGTASYMSPEQVRGQTADHRSDIFSFGAILYEMLSGNRAFQRGSTVETMNAILKEEPADLSSTRSGLSPDLDRIVHHCLEKSPTERFQSARDLAFDLQSTSGSLGISSAPSGLRIRPSRRQVWRTALGAVVLAAVAAVAFWAGGQIQKAPVSAEAPSFQALTFRRGTVWSARFAPGGHTVVFGASWDGKPVGVFSRRLESPVSSPLGLEDTDLLSVSSGGELAILSRRRMSTGWMSRGTLARAPLGGGSPRVLAEDIQHADWSPDGTKLATIRFGREGYRLEYPMGTVLHETTGWLSWLRVSPDGKTVAFLDHPVPGDNNGSVAVVDLEGNKTTLTQQMKNTGGLAWTPDGREIWFGAAEWGFTRDLHAVSLSKDSRRVLRIPGDLTIHDIHADGRVLISQDDLRREMIAVTREHPEGRNLSWLDWSLPTDISPDGRKILFVEQGKGAGKDYVTYLRNIDGSPPIRLGAGQPTALSPNQEWVLGISVGDLTTLRLLPTGAGDSRDLDLGSIQSTFSGAWFPDGKRILFGGRESQQGIRIYAMDVENGTPEAISQEGSTIGFSNAVSPDGKWVAALDAQGEVILYPAEGGEPRPVRGIREGEGAIQWYQDGRRLLVGWSDEPPWEVYLLDPETGERELQATIVPSDPAGILDIGPVIMTPDAGTYLYGYKRAISTLYLVKGLR